MKKTTSLLTIAVMGILAMPVQAQHNQYDPNRRVDRIEQHLTNLHYRIQDGIKYGELTRIEARYLRHQQRYIVRLTHRFMHDGYLDRRELRELSNELKRTNEHIYRLKHNHINRFAGSYYY